MGHRVDGENGYECGSGFFGLAIICFLDWGFVKFSCSHLSFSLEEFGGDDSQFE
jgi:hypothetical protein